MTAISTHRLSSARLLQSQRHPYATRLTQMYATASVQSLDQNPFLQSTGSEKNGYLMVLDKRKGHSNVAWALEYCVVTHDAKLARLTGSVSRPMPFLHLDDCLFRMVNSSNAQSRRNRMSSAFGARNAIEVVDSVTSVPLVYLQASTKAETRAWLVELRHYAKDRILLPSTSDNAKVFQRSPPSKPNNSALDKATSNERRNSSKRETEHKTSSLSLHRLERQPSPPTPKSPSAATFLHLYKPPHSVQAPIQPTSCSALQTATKTRQGLQMAKRAKACKPSTTSFSSYPSVLTHKMPDILDRASVRSAHSAVRVLTAGVLYLRILGERQPVPHVLAASAQWQPYVGVLAQCEDSTGLFLFDPNDSPSVVAELDVNLLCVHDIQPLDDSLFDASFAFSVHVRDPSVLDSLRTCRSTMTDAFNLDFAKYFDDDISIFSKATASSTSSSNSGNDCDISAKDHGSPLLDSKWSFVDSGKETPEQHHIRGRSRSLGDVFDTSSIENGSGSGYLEEDHRGNPNINAAGAAVPPYTLYLSTMRASERSGWISHLRRLARLPLICKNPHPQKVNSNLPPLVPVIEYRIERSLWIGIYELRGLSAGASNAVTAMLALDGQPIAHCDIPFTQAGTKRESAAQQHLFGCLPPIRQGVTVVVVQSEPKSDEAGGLLGYCHIPIPFMRHASTYDGWYPLCYGPVHAFDSHLSPYVPLAKNIHPIIDRWTGAPQPTDIKIDTTAHSMPFRSADVHIQVRYDELVVFTQPFYSGIVQLIFDTNPTLVFDLATIVPRSADWLVETLAKVALANNRFEHWIEALVTHELEAQTVRDPALIFRGSSVTTRAMDTLMKVSGLSFLDQMVGDVVRAVVCSDHRCEVDPAKLTVGDSIENHWVVLTQLLQALWRSIEESKDCCPLEMRCAFACVRRVILAFYTEESAQSQVRYSCISGFLFLRLVCPAMLSPKAFGLVSKSPSASALRTLTLLAKGIQCTANLTDFTQKEPYMQPMNSSIRQSIPKLKDFIDYIASDKHSDAYNNDIVTDNEVQIAIDGERELAAFCAFVFSVQDEIKEHLAGANAAYLRSMANTTTPQQKPLITRTGSVSGPSSPTTALDPAESLASDTTCAEPLHIPPLPNCKAEQQSTPNRIISQHLRPFRKASDGHISARRKASHMLMLDLSYQTSANTLSNKRKSDSTAVKQPNIKNIEHLLLLCQKLQGYAKKFVLT
ncbi:Ras GTPase-activating protein 1 [Coemansia sp. RSA 1358]|nr:Ras GTPase-activating protein 1 [Coemansia sp. RSA 1358]